jgi:hypothetical protein
MQGTIKCTNIPKVAQEELEPMAGHGCSKHDTIVRSP